MTQLPLALAPPASSGRLRVRPVPLATARAVVTLLHRHHPAPLGHVASFGAYQGARLVGVAVLGRPVSRVLDARGWLEVTRVATDGTSGACSALYAACAREADERGAPCVCTYILAAEGGASLRGAGWERESDVRSRSWDTPSRPRSTAVLGPKARWVRWLGFCTRATGGPCEAPREASYRPYLETNRTAQVDPGE